MSSLPLLCKFSLRFKANSYHTNHVSVWHSCGFMCLLALFYKEDQQSHWNQTELWVCFACWVQEGSLSEHFISTFLSRTGPCIHLLYKGMLFSSWPQVHYVGEDDLELLIFLSLASQFPVWFVWWGTLNMGLHSGYSIIWPTEPLYPRLMNDSISSDVRSKFLKEHIYFYRSLESPSPSLISPFSSVGLWWAIQAKNPTLIKFKDISV